MARPKKQPARPRKAPDSERLTYKQSLFVSYYLGEANGNATEAARMARYANAEIGRQLLRNITIVAAIAARLEGPAMAADEVLARLSDMASVDMADFVTINKQGHRVDVAKAVKAGKSHLIKKLTPTKFGLSIELHDSQSALEKLGRYHGLFKDKLTVTADAEPSKTLEKLKQKLDGLPQRDPGEGDPGGG